MTTEELESKLKISKNTCIHCPTLELAKQVLSIFDQLGLKWCSGKSYIIHTGWDNHEENTIYYPFDGEFSSLEFANLTGYKIINAEEFIALHIEEKGFDLENYIPKGQLEGFPKEIIARMLDCQQEQGNPRDISVFEKQCDAGAFNEGFTWDETQEGFGFWEEVIDNKNFNLFFEQYPKPDSQDFRVDDLENYEPKGELKGFPKEIIARMLECQKEQGNKIDVSVFEKHRTSDDDGKGFNWSITKEGSTFWENIIRHKNFTLFFERYPKKEEIKVCSKCKERRKQELKNNKNMQENNKKEDNSQKFRVGDKVIDIILDLKGIITNVKSNGSLVIQFEGKSGITEYNLKIEKRPSLLHYRDDYDYDVIDFNNLPKRQETKRWRAEKNRIYYYVNFYTKDWFLPDETYDYYTPMDHDNYNSGNYFRTEVEAETIAQKLNEYFKQLIQEEHE